MDYVLEDAIVVAAEAHKGQLDKTGHPYIFHPLRVMLNCQSTDEKIVGVLHDVIEDTDYTARDLRVLFPSEIVDAVVAITKEVDETNVDYIARCKDNEIARRVKIADISDNLSPIRQVNLDVKTQDRLREKYLKGLKSLLE